MDLDICRDAWALRSSFGTRARDEALRRAGERAAAAVALHWRRVAVLLTAARA